MMIITFATINKIFNHYGSYEDKELRNICHMLYRGINQNLENFHIYSLKKSSSWKQELVDYQPQSIIIGIMEYMFNEFIWQFNRGFQSEEKMGITWIQSKNQ